MGFTVFWIFVVLLFQVLNIPFKYVKLDFGTRLEIKILTTIYGPSITHEDDHYAKKKNGFNWFHNSEIILYQHFPIKV